MSKNFVKTKMTPTEFEILVKNLFEDRLKAQFGYKIPVEHLKKFTSAAGNVYEIDLSYQFNLFDMSYLTLVECKHWDSHVTREKVGYLQSIMDELKAHKGIVVTTKGFQNGAIEYAQSNNIGLIKVTNDNSFETFSHFDGHASEAQEILEKEETSILQKILHLLDYFITRQTFSISLE
jgi:restriction endonuclease Mrr